jgi:tetratricopeptide (TPR) repeat protein
MKRFLFGSAKARRWVGLILKEEISHPQLNPNYPTAHQWYGLMLATLGRFPEAEGEVIRAQQLDPLSPIINMAVAEVYNWEHRYDRAIEQYTKVIALDPSFARAYGNLAGVYEQKHLYSEAVSAKQQEWNLNGDPMFARVIERAYSNSGYSALIREELNRVLQERAKGQYADAIAIAGYYAELGHESDAFLWFQRLRGAFQRDAVSGRSAGFRLAPVEHSVPILAQRFRSTARQDHRRRPT